MVTTSYPINGLSVKGCSNREFEPIKANAEIKYYRNELEFGDTITKIYF